MRNSRRVLGRNTLTLPVGKCSVYFAFGNLGEAGLLELSETSVLGGYKDWCTQGLAAMAELAVSIYTVLL